MSSRLVLAICLAGLALAVALVMRDEAPRTAGTNLVTGTGFPIDVPAGGELCQDLELVAGDTGSMLVNVLKVDGESPLAVRIVKDDGALLARGDVAGGYAPGPLSVALTPGVERATSSRVCIENRGDAVVGFGSSSTPQEQAARIDGGVQAGRIRIEYIRPGSESWWALLPTIAHRFGLGKADGLGSWTLWASGLILALAIALSARLVAGRDAA